MANHSTNIAKKKSLDWLTDLRAMLVMSNSTVDTEKDKTVITGYTTLDEMDGAGYGRQTCTAETVVQDDGNNRGEITVGTVTFSGVSAGTRQVIGCLFYQHVATDADHIPAFFVDDDAPYDPGGGDIVYTINAEGLAQLS